MDEVTECQRCVVLNRFVPGWSKIGPVVSVVWEGIVPGLHLLLLRAVRLPRGTSDAEARAETLEIECICIPGN
jgi:hypothetical protein